MFKGHIVNNKVIRGSIISNIIYKNIKKTYNGKKILDIKELFFEFKKIYGLKGFNGSGKTTLCKILAKLEKPDEVIKYPDISIGYMSQFSYVFDMTVKQNMLLNKSKNFNDAEEKMLELLNIFGIDKYVNKNAKKLSGGEKQKLCLARLLLKKYDLLILDEPTSNMDFKSIIVAEDIIKKYVEDNNSIVIMVSHEEGEIERMTKNIINIGDL